MLEKLHKTLGSRWSLPPNALIGGGNDGTPLGSRLRGNDGVKQ
jgi:hypothetical protein